MIVIEYLIFIFLLNFMIIVQLHFPVAPLETLNNTRSPHHHFTDNKELKTHHPSTGCTSITARHQTRTIKPPVISPYPLQYPSHVKLSTTPLYNHITLTTTFHYTHILLSPLPSTTFPINPTIFVPTTNPFHRPSTIIQQQTTATTMTTTMTTTNTKTKINTKTKTKTKTNTKTTIMTTPSSSSTDTILLSILHLTSHPFSCSSQKSRHS